MIFVDTAKGFAPALTGDARARSSAGVLAGGAAVLGNWRPIFLGFKRGGKIVATTGGAFSRLRADRRRRSASGVWLLVFLTTRYVVARVDDRRRSRCPLLAAVLG